MANKDLRPSEPDPLYLDILEQFILIHVNRREARYISADDIRREAKKQFKVLSDKRHRFNHITMFIKAFRWFKSHPKWVEFAVGTFHWIFPSGIHKARQKGEVISRRKNKDGLIMLKFKFGKSEIIMEESLAHYRKTSR